MKVTIRNDSVEVSGYVNAVDRDSRPLRDRKGFFIERVEPGAFARSLSRVKPMMLLNHDINHVIAEPGNKDFMIKEDAVGLFVRAVVTDAEVIKKAKEGSLRGWSFGFVPIKESENEYDGMRHRVLQDIDIKEVSLLDSTRTPAYIATSVMTRDSEEEISIREMEFQEVETEQVRSSIDYSPYTKVLEELSK